jgi:hypothetical protein
MNLCECCEGENNGNYGSGRFCSSKCARSFSTKSKRLLINEAVSKKLSKVPYKKVCNFCEKEFETKRNKIKYCSIKCSNSHISDSRRINLSKASSKRCSTLEERVRMKEIGRYGGFGTKGRTKGSVYYESKFEKVCFEYLENNNIMFEAHKKIPNSSKVSDIYLPNINIWIELDGINRKKRKKWLGKQYQYWLNKIEIYNEQNLNYRIFYNIEQLIEFINN